MLQREGFELQLFSVDPSNNSQFVTIVKSKNENYILNIGGNT